MYISNMVTLDINHPETKEQFDQGNFVVKRSHHPFSQVAVDQSIEQIMNRDTKVKGGILGKSLKKGTPFSLFNKNIDTNVT